jgi:CheY-like chemotaxis protein
MDIRQITITGRQLSAGALDQLAGMDDHLAKPLRSAELRNTLDKRGSQ